MKLHEIQLAKLHPAQAEIARSNVRFKVLVCGRRFGKTTIAVDTICDQLLDGNSAAYFAPTFRMGYEVWRDLHTILRPLIRYSREDDWRMELRTGGVYEGWSMAQGAGESVRGRKYHYVVIDEAAIFPNADVWHGAIRPLLTDYEGGALFASTPKGRNWFWQLYLQGQSDDFREWQSWRFPTTANPYIKAEEVEAAQEGMPERFFRQEYEATFLEDGGVVFRNIDKVCVGETESVPREDESYSFGVDWGREFDYTCVSVMTRDGKQVYLERFNKIGWEVQRGRLAALNERFKPTVILAEENSIGSVNIEALQAEGLPMRAFTTTAKSKAPLIEQLVLAMEKEEVVLLRNEILKQELMAYAMARTASGWKYSAPTGLHDDTVIATALSLHATRYYGRVSIDWV